MLPSPGAVGTSGRVSVAIQHHPKRAGLIPDLLAALDAPAVVCTDPDPGKDRTNSWTTYRLCLAHAPDDGHLLVLQDDVEPCRNLVAAAEQIARYFPQGVVCLWHGKQPTRGAIQYRIAAGEGCRYVVIRAQPWVPLVATLWPARLARQLATWSDANPIRLRQVRADDGVVALYLSAVNRVSVYATLPSLVEHPDRDSIRKQVRGRVALDFIGDDDPLDLDWNPSASCINGAKKPRSARGLR